MDLRWRFLGAIGSWIQKSTRKFLRFSSLRGFVVLFLMGATLSLTIAACSGDNTNTANSGGSSSPAGNTASPVASQKKDVELTLVAYAIPKAAHDAIIPKFVEQWKKDHNQNVTFKQSYGGSGSQARAVVDGLEADVVHLALASDVSRLQKAGLIEAGWEKEYPNDSIVAKSVAAIVTREGNPKGIKDWPDLAKDDVKVVTANPKTSGGARWNFAVLWGSVLKAGGDEAKAKDFVTKVIKNAPVLPKDAREASDAFFKQGQGDALLNYENEIILANQKGEKVPYVVPAVNISIDTPVAVVDKNVEKHGTREVAEAFTKYLFSPEAQKEFVKLGYRPAAANLEKDKALSDKFPKVNTLFTIKDLGGWSEVQKKFFDDGGIFDEITGKK